MDSSIITEDELLKENKTKNDKAENNNTAEVKAEGFDNPDAYHK
jgi:hypothetical protein